jgi:phytoene dehydrogenase-like protein
MTLLSGEPERWCVDPEQIHGPGYRATPAYLELKQRIEDALVDKLEARFPGVKDHIVYRESATPVTHSRYTRATGGTGYGIACTPEQFMGRRPGYRGPLPGSYLCGASTRAGHGIVGAMSSGVHAARRIARDLDVALVG